MSYEERMQQSAPPPFQDPYGLSWNGGIGQNLDELLADFKAAVKARMPGLAGANSDALALSYIGSDSSMPRYPAESDAEYGDRLQQRWALYERAGAAAGSTLDNPIVTTLEGLGFGGVVVMEYQDWPDAPEIPIPGTHHSPGSWYDSTGATPWWSRFWVYIGDYNGAPIPAGGVLGAGVLGTMVLGFDLDPDVVSSAVQAILQWKPAYALAVSITFLLGTSTTGSVLGVGTLGTMVLGDTGGDGSSTYVINK